jgi:hypothetical protein
VPKVEIGEKAFELSDKQLKQYQMTISAVVDSGIEVTDEQKMKIVEKLTTTQSQLSVIRAGIKQVLTSPENEALLHEVGLEPDNDCELGVKRASDGREARLTFAAKYVRKS